MARHNVLILSAGRRVELLQAFQHELTARIGGASVYAADLRPDLSSACQLAACSFAVPRATDASYPAFLAELCAQQNIGLIVPTIDTELLVLSEHREAFAKDETEIAVSDAKLILQCRDKRKTATLFASIGIDTPRIFAPDSITFPCFAKPYDGSSSAGAQRVDSADVAALLLAENDRMMFMELVGSDHREFTVDAYFDRGGTMRAMVPRERIETRAGEVSKGVTRRGAVGDWLASRLGRLQGARGCITLQLFVKPDGSSFRAIEINPRFGGGFPLSYASGANFPGWLIDEYIMQAAPDFTDIWEADLLMLRYDAKVLSHGFHETR
jgi:carbamoyl-phosphate synthase large subunit